MHEAPERCGKPEDDGPDKDGYPSPRGTVSV